MCSANQGGGEGKWNWIELKEFVGGRFAGCSLRLRLYSNVVRAGIIEPYYTLGYRR